MSKDEPRINVDFAASGKHRTVWVARDTLLPGSFRSNQMRYGELDWITESANVVQSE
jgi:hypothetical protein